jgi:endonuclease YncB( thermonuclease family)
MGNICCSPKLSDPEFSPDNVEAVNSPDHESSPGPDIKGSVDNSPNPDDNLHAPEIKLETMETDLRELGLSESEIKLINADFNVPEFSLKGLNIYGKIVYVYDGDTVHAVINFNNVLTKFVCRLINIDSPEIATKNLIEKASAMKSRDYLIEKLTGEKVVNEGMSKKEVKEFCSKSRKLIFIKCLEFDKYGRLLVELFNDENSTKSINQDMLDNSYAVEYDGGTKKEFNLDNFN